MPNLKVDSIFVYPVKSLRGIAVDSALFTPTGVLYDRRFMLLRDHGVPEKNPKDPSSHYQNMHVPHFPQMCLFTTTFSTLPGSISPDSVSVTYTDPDNKRQESIQIPLQPSTDDLDRILVNMHQSRVTGFVMPRHFNDWFTSRFRFPVVLAYLGPETEPHGNYRPVLGNIAPNAAVRNPILHAQYLNRSSSRRGFFSAMLNALRSIEVTSDEDADYKVSFADCAPFMVVSRTSVDEVDTRLEVGDHADVTKFRPNIVLSGAEEPWEEDYWALLSIHPSNGAAPIQMPITANCVRCASLNVDYSTGRFGKQDLLKKLMKDRRLDKGAPYSPCFGRYGFLQDRGGSRFVSVGDDVRVVEQNDERTVLRWPGIGATKKDDLWGTAEL